MHFQQQPGTISAVQPLGPGSHQALEPGAFGAAFQKVNRVSDVQVVEPASR